MIVIRKLLPIELGAYRAHLLRLSADERSMRFSGGFGDSGITQYVRNLDRKRSAVFAAFAGGEVRGAIDITRIDADSAEVSVSVEGGWQDRGIGTALVRRALLYARIRSIRTVFGVWLNDNHRMQRIFQKLDGQTTLEQGMTQGAVELAGPTLATFAEEATAQLAALVLAPLDWLVGKLTPRPALGR